MPCPKFNKKKAEGALKYVNKFFHEPGQMDLASFIEESDKYLKTLSKQEVDSIQKDVIRILNGAKNKSASLRRTMGGMRGGATVATLSTEINAYKDAPDDAARDTAKQALIAKIKEQSDQAARKTLLGEVNNSLGNSTLDITDAEVDIQPVVPDPGAAGALGAAGYAAAAAGAAAVGTMDAATVTAVRGHIEEAQKQLGQALEKMPPALGGGSGQMPQGPAGRGFVRGIIRVAATLILPRTRTGVIYSSIWIAIFWMVGFGSDANQAFLRAGITQISDGSCLSVTGMFDFTRHPLCTGWRMIVIPIIEGANELYGWRITGLARMLTGISIATAVPMTMEASVYELAYHTDYLVTTVIQAFYGLELRPPTRTPGRRSLPEILSLAANMTRPGHSVPLLYGQQPAYAQPLAPPQFMPAAQAQPIPFAQGYPQAFPQGPFPQAQPYQGAFPQAQAYPGSVHQPFPQAFPQAQAYPGYPGAYPGYPQAQAYPGSHPGAYPQQVFQQMPRAEHMYHSRGRAEYSPNRGRAEMRGPANNPGVFFQPRQRSRSRSMPRNNRYTRNNRRASNNRFSQARSRSSRNDRRNDQSNQDDQSNRSSRSSRNRNDRPSRNRSRRR